VVEAAVKVAAAEQTLWHALTQHSKDFAGHSSGLQK